MVIDCDCCVARGNACQDCVVSVLLGVPSPANGSEAGNVTPSTASTVHLDAPEQRALEVLADQGLVPRLRLVPGEPTRRTAATSENSGYCDVG